MAKGKGEHKETILTLEDQIQMLHEHDGIPIEDARHFFNKRAALGKRYVEEQSDKGVGKFGMQHEFGGVGFILRDEAVAKRDDGTLHKLPKHYDSYGISSVPLLELANSKFDLTIKALSKEEIKAAKVA